MIFRKQKEMLNYHIEKKKTYVRAICYLFEQLHEKKSNILLKYLWLAVKLGKKQKHLRTQPNLIFRFSSRVPNVYLRVFCLLNQTYCKQKMNRVNNPVHRSNLFDVSSDLTKLYLLHFKSMSLNCSSVLVKVANLIYNSYCCVT